MLSPRKHGGRSLCPMQASRRRVIRSAAGPAYGVGSREMTERELTESARSMQAQAPGLGLAFLVRRLRRVETIAADLWLRRSHHLNTDVREDLAQVGRLALLGVLSHL